MDELLLYGADPCLPLTHGVGSALCVATSTEYENRRTPDARIKLVSVLTLQDFSKIACLLESNVTFLHVWNRTVATHNI